MTAVNRESPETNSLYIMIFAVTIIFMLVLSTFLTVSAISGNTIFTSDTDTASSQEVDPVSDVERLQLMAGDDAGWSDAETTSMAVLALNLAGTTPDETWENSNGVTVSIANSQVPN